MTAASNRPDRDQGSAPALVVAGAIIDGSRCLVARRGPAMRHPGAWEFPGGKVEPGETRRQALTRELAEELAVEVAVERYLGRSEVPGPPMPLVLELFAARVTAGTPAPVEHAELRWVRGNELETLSWAPADVPLLEAVRACLDP